MAGQPGKTGKALARGPLQAARASSSEAARERAIWNADCASRHCPGHPGLADPLSGWHPCLPYRLGRQRGLLPPRGLPALAAICHVPQPRLATPTGRHSRSSWPPPVTGPRRRRSQTGSDPRQNRRICVWQHGATNTTLAECWLANASSTAQFALMRVRQPPPSPARCGQGRRVAPPAIPRLRPATGRRRPAR